MSADFTLRPHADYVHVELASGYEIKPVSIAALAHAISEACARQAMRRVLIEGAVARREMAAMESFSSGMLVGSLLPGVAIACCFYGYAPDEQSQFFKDVAQNRGARVEFFLEREAALRWLGV